MTGIQIPHTIRGVALPVTFSVLAGLVIGALFLVGTGADPFTAYGAVLTGSLGADGIGSTLSTGTSVLGMALALAIPLRAGLINLGGDGQLVLGGITAAVTGLYSPLPAPLTVVLALLAGMAAGAAYATLAALCENRLGVPLLVSSLLLSYPAVSLASYLARYPLKEPGSSLPQTRPLPDGVALPAFGDSTVTVGLVLVVLAAAAYWFTDKRTAFGYEIRMTGLNSRFAAYAGVERRGLTLKLMSVSGALAGLVGAIGVLSFPYRFVDGSLTAPGYTWTGLTAALLAAAGPARHGRRVLLLRRPRGRRPGDGADDRGAARADAGAPGHRDRVPRGPTAFPGRRWFTRRAREDRDDSAQEASPETAQQIGAL